MALRNLCVYTTRNAGCIFLHQNVSRVTLNAVCPLILRRAQIPCQSQIRTLMRDFKRDRKVKPKHGEDKLSEEYQFIYSSENVNIYYYGFGFLVCAVIGLSTFFVHFLYKYYWSLESLPEISMFGLSSDLSREFIPFCFFLLFNMSYIAIILKRMYKHLVFRLYYHPHKDHYVAILLAPKRSNKLTFKASDVQYHPLKRKQLGGEFKIKGRRYIISKSGFLGTSHHYNRLMGHERPDIPKMGITERKPLKTTLEKKDQYSKKRQQQKE